jgi:myo-inositol-1(or 4)-monophosphatase
MNLKQTLYDTIHSTKLARKVLLDYFGRLSQVEEKHLAGLVSEADKESEKVIKNFLLLHLTYALLSSNVTVSHCGS